MDSTETTERVWGAPPADEAHWSTKKTLAAAGIAVALAAGGGAVIHAADSGSQRGFGGGPGFGGPGGPGFGAGPGGQGGPGQGGPDGALHGEFVVPDGHGGYSTELTQTGTVTDISDTAITAKSADGYSRTYVINTDTRQGRHAPQTGESVSIRADLVDGNATATEVTATH